MDTLTRTARRTGAAYLALAVFGMAGFLVIRPQLYIAGDPAATLAALEAHTALAHLWVVLEVGVVAAQALAALGFYALFRDDRPAAAFGVATFGMANAAAILGSAAMMITAVGVAEDSAADAGAPASVGLLLQISLAFWTAGGLFFGLWLIPMGAYVLSTSRMPRLLGWLLIVGGAGYVAGTVVGIGWAGAPAWLVDGLPLPATVAEFWMIGYLLVRGIRPMPAASATDPGTRATVAP
ncbi:DUF4386 domain-containing protein [Microbacterium sp. CPCC 204701]|uniref:DUF4386 domain-containing protein n=1 Tax=Microbacterium sp. CPCC 204701 TaxID=2493084 RepID=UPI000FDC4836|nr:DUF4386 domain-containing protein [Microbacterium sp. CPCC 204701]